MTATLLPRAFWFLRHGETDWNAQHLSQGNIDIPLNATGRAQAVTAADMLRHRGIATIVSSPLSRAHDTALAFARTVGLTVSLDEGLREVSFGVQDGQPMSEWFSDWVAGHSTPENAESFSSLRARAVAAINRALAQPAPVLVVGHGALFRALRAEMGLEANVRTANAMPFFCRPASPAWELVPASEIR